MSSKKFSTFILFQMWRRDEYNMLSPELDYCFNASMFATLTGALIGAYKVSRDEFTRFMAVNKHEMFKHPREAQKSLQDRVVIGMFKGAYRFGWRICLLTSAFTCISTSLTVVRNCVNPLDHAVSGAAIGGMYRLWGGPRGIIVGGLLGGSLGLTSGCATWALQYLTGETVEQRWLREYRFVRANISIEAGKIRGQQLASVPRDRWLAQQEEDKEAEGEEGESKTTLMIRSALLRIRNIAGLDGVKWE